MSEEKLIKELDTLMIRELYIGESTEECPIGGNR